MANLLGTKSTITLLASEDPQDFLEGIAYLYPRGYTKAPLMALSATLPRIASSSMDINHYEEGFPTMQVTVATEVAASGTSITTSETGGALITRKWTQMRNETTGEVFIVSADGSGTTITTTAAYRGFGTTAAAIMPAGSKITVIGSASAEIGTSPTPQGSSPTLVSNYLQDIKESFEVGDIVAATQLRSGDLYTNDHFKALTRWAVKAENAFFWSELAKVTDTGGTYNRGNRGLNASITTNRTTVDGAIGKAAMKSILKDVMTYSSDSSGEKVCFCGNSFAQAFFDIAEDDVQINATNETDTFGLGFMEYRTPFGKVFLKPHPLFNANASWTGHAFFVDVPNIKYRYKDGTDANGVGFDLNLRENIKKDDGYTGRKDEFRGVIGLETWHESTHGVVLGVTGWSGN